MINNLIIFATYWNEIEWIETSLRQIEIINPVEIIICDGCFDARHPVHSTDGTKEVIEDFIKNRTNATMIAPVRTNRLRAFLKMLKGHGKGERKSVLTPARFKALLTVFFTDQYRLDQALTFQKMISLSKAWRPGNWFMTYDADQYYSDDIIDSFKKLNNEEPADLITANERTFFLNFKSFTDQYEKRTFNNMPHKIKQTTNIMPTRDIVLEDFSFNSFKLSGFMKSDRYIYKVPSVNIGCYHHYKFRLDSKRTNMGYMVGDRQKPQITQYELVFFSGSHPAIVQPLIHRWKNRV